MPDDATAFDRHMMSIALAMAQRGLGRTAPNPAVGAVIADETSYQVIARGWTQPGGRPHAEVEAIARAGAQAHGKTIYVTLEPCSHTGVTGPCAVAIIAAGLKRVVCAVLDPDPRVSGRGVRMLREAGLEVSRGVLADEAHWITRGHILRVTERRPLIQLKMALAANGQVATGRDGRPVWVTGPAARAHGHLLRAGADAILVGAGTLRDDDPELTCRLPGLAHRSPLRVVLAGGEIPATTSKLVQSARRVPVVIVVGNDVDASRLQPLAAIGCRIVQVATVGGRPWLPAVMEALVSDGVTRLLVEGGPTMWEAFAAANLVDEIHQYRVLQNDLGPARQAAMRDLSRWAPQLGFDMVEQREVGPDGLFVFRRR